MIREHRHLRHEPFCPSKVQSMPCEPSELKWDRWTKLYFEDGTVELI